MIAPKSQASSHFPGVGPWLVALFLLLIVVRLGAVAELERNLIAERVRAGQAAAKRRGVKFGRPSASVDARQIERLRAQGISYAEIAERLQISTGTAFRMAQRPRT